MANIAQCAPRNRCRKWRECDSCARIRQAQIADVAEWGSRTSPVIQYAVIRTHAPQNLKQDKARLLGTLRNISDGGIWTIETGHVNGLHINIIAGTEKPVTMAKLTKCWHSDADVALQEIGHDDVRTVAAYSAKKAGFPEKREFSGHLYGSYGTFKKPLGALLTERAFENKPILATFAMEHEFERMGIPQPDPLPEPRYKPPVNVRPSKHATPEDEKQRLIDNRESLVQASADYRKAKSDHARNNELRRLIAVHAGEIQLKGIAFIPGYGLISTGDAKKLGIDIDGPMIGSSIDVYE